MGSTRFEYQSSREIFSDITNDVSMYSGFSYESLDSGGMVWNSKSWEKLFKTNGDEHSTNNENILLQFEPVRSIEKIDPLTTTEFPYLLVQGRVLFDDEISSFAHITKNF